MNINKFTKAFTVIELAVSIGIMSIISGLAIKQVYHQQYLDSVDDMFENINGVIDYAITDTNRGFVNGNGGWCSSSSGDFRFISANRVKECSGLSTYTVEDVDGTLSTNETDSDNTTGTETYFTGKEFLAGYVSGGCQLYIDEIDDNEIYLYLDCNPTGVTTLSNNDLDYIEDKFQTNFTKNYSVRVRNYYRLANSTANFAGVGGTENDGKISVHLEY